MQSLRGAEGAEATLSEGKVELHGLELEKRLLQYRQLGAIHGF